MLIWLIVIAIMVILAVTSYYKGALRSLVSLTGLIAALILTGPIAPLLKPLVPKVGLTHPVWPVVLPPVVVFALFVLIFTGLGFLVHHKLALRIKYKTDEVTWIRWGRMNQRLGASVGLLAGLIYTVLVTLIVYVLGYPCVQVTGDDSPATLKYLKQAREQLRDTGLDKSLAAFDPMPENYYLTCDVIGLLYHNHVLQDRLMNYPAFLALSERSEFQEIATDVDLQGLLQTKGPFVNVINHAKVQAVVANDEIVQELKKIDLKDLQKYLKTGVSDKYSEEKVLGRWKLDTSATLTTMKKRNPDMPAPQMAMLKKLVSIFLPKVSLLATPDNKVIMKMELTEEAQKIIQAAQAALNAPPPEQEEAAPAPQMDERMMRRYGLMGRGRAMMRAGPAPDTARPAPPKPSSPMVAAGVADVNFSGQGSWERVGDKYRIKFQDERGKEHSGEATADEEKLALNIQGQTLVFAR